MEYIRMHNGYVQTSLERFCQGDFEVHDFAPDWDLHSGHYPLSPAFIRAFEQTIGKPFASGPGTPDESARLRELLAYGRYDFRPTGDTVRRTQLYTYYYMRRSYCAARALYETIGSWLFPAVRNVSGRVVFCDLSYEGGASGLAFADACRRLPHAGIAYLGICPIEEMQDTARRMFQTEGYQAVQALFHARLEDVPASFWHAHATVSELIVFNVSNLTGRIPPAESRHLAWQINRLVQAYPLNRFALLLRDDAGERRNVHAYQAFCAQLSPACAAYRKHARRREILLHPQPHGVRSGIRNLLLRGAGHSVIFLLGISRHGVEKLSSFGISCRRRCQAFQLWDSVSPAAASFPALGFRAAGGGKLSSFGIPCRRRWQAFQPWDSVPPTVASFPALGFRAAGGGKLSSFGISCRRRWQAFQLWDSVPYV